MSIKPRISDQELAEAWFSKAPIGEIVLKFNLSRQNIYDRWFSLKKKGLVPAHTRRDWVRANGFVPTPPPPQARRSYSAEEEDEFEVYAVKYPEYDILLERLKKFGHAYAE